MNDFASDLGRPCTTCALLADPVIPYLIPRPHVQKFILDGAPSLLWTRKMLLIVKLKHEKGLGNCWIIGAKSPNRLNSLTVHYIPTIARTRRDNHNTSSTTIRPSIRPESLIFAFDCDCCSGLIRSLTQLQFQSIELPNKNRVSDTTLASRSELPPT